MKKNDELEALLEEIKEEARKKLAILHEQGVKTGKEACGFLDRYAYQKPWVIAGAMAFLAGILGFILGRKSKS